MLFDLREPFAPQVESQVIVGVTDKSPSSFGTLSMFPIARKAYGSREKKRQKSKNRDRNRTQKLQLFKCFLRDSGSTP